MCFIVITFFSVISNCASVLVNQARLTYDHMFVHICMFEVCKAHTGIANPVLAGFSVLLCNQHHHCAITSVLILVQCEFQISCKSTRSCELSVMPLA
jgi:hypothetical protein